MNELTVRVKAREVRRRDLLVDHVAQNRVWLPKQQVEIAVDANCSALKLGERLRDKKLS